MRKIKWFFLLGLSTLILAGMTGLTIVLARLIPTGPGLTIPEQADAQTYAELALQLANRSYWLEAEQLNQRALSLQPFHPTLHYNQGWLAARQGKWQEALTHLNQALLLDPEHAAARLNRAWVYQQLGQTASGAQDLKTYQGLPAVTELPLEQVRRQQLMGQHADAVSGLTALIAAQPEQLGLYYWRSRSLIAQNQIGSAIEDLGHILRVQPDATLYAERAELWLKQAKLNEAVADLERSLLLQAQDTVRLQLARLYLQLAQPEKAQLHLQQLALTTDSEVDAEMATEQARLRIEVLLAQGQQQLAQTQLEAALQQSPEQAGLWLLQARILRQKRQYTAATEAIEKASALGYRQSRVTIERALLAAQRGQREQARDYVQQALKTEPELKPQLQSERLLKALF